MPARVRTTKTAEVSKRGPLTVGVIAEAMEDFAAVGASDSASVGIASEGAVIQFTATWQIGSDVAELAMPGMGTK